MRAERCERQRCQLDKLCGGQRPSHGLLVGSRPTVAESLEPRSRVPPGAAGVAARRAALSPPEHCELVPPEHTVAELSTAPTVTKTWIGISRAAAAGYAALNVSAYPSSNVTATVASG